MVIGIVTVSAVGDGEYVESKFFLIFYLQCCIANWRHLGC